jgi:hypothetical protein
MIYTIGCGQFNRHDIAKNNIATGVILGTEHGKKRLFLFLPFICGARR